MKLHTVAGDGVLAREGELVVLCAAGADAGPGTDGVVDELIEAHRMVADEGGDGAALADAVVRVASGHEISLVAFAPSAGSLVVTVFGRGWAIVATEHGEQRLAPRHTPPDGLRSMVPGAVLTIRAGIGDVRTDAPVQRWSELRAGVTRAGGLVLAATDDPPGLSGAGADSGEPATEALRVGDRTPIPPSRARHSDPEPDLESDAAPEPDAAPDRDERPEPGVESNPEPDHAPDDGAGGSGPPGLPSVHVPDVAVDRTEPFTAVVLVGSGAAPTGPLTVLRAPLPIATRPPEPEAPEAPVPSHPPPDDTTTVIGVYCKNGHFDDPAARYCAVCGISMAQQTLVPRPGPRPPLGVLVLDDGSIFSLDTDYVVGRDPSRDPDVMSGAARPLRIDDPEGLLSRVHARIHLEGWDVAVVDLGSSNGTGVWGPHDSAWVRAPALASMVVRPGTQIGVGRRQMRYESHRNS